MTISTTSRLAGPFLGTGAAAAMPFAFKVFSASDVAVFRSGEVLPDGYTIALNSNQNGNPGGTVNISAGANTLGASFFIGSAVEATQSASLPGQSAFYPKVIEDALDRNTILVQQLGEVASRAFVSPLGEAAHTLPSRAELEGKVLGFEDGKAVAASPIPEPIPGPKGDPGTPGGNVESIGLLTGAAGLAIPAGTARERTSGYGAVGTGAANYVHDDSFNLAAHPRAGFVAADGRVFKLDITGQFITPYSFGTPNDGVSDAAAGLQAFFDFCHAFSVALPYVAGYYFTSQTIAIGALGSNHATPRYYGGSFIVHASAPMDALFTFTNLTAVYFGGRWSLRGNVNGSGTAWAARTRVGCGARLRSCRSCTFEHIMAQYFWFGGVITDPSGNNNFIEIRHFQGDYIGSGYATTQSLQATWSNPVNAGSSSSFAQYTTIDVSALPPENLTAMEPAVGDSPLQVRIGGHLHWITSIDRVNGKLQVYPWVSSTLGNSGQMVYVWGGGIHIRGTDANCWVIGVCEAGNSSRALAWTSLYGPSVHMLSAQYCGTGLLIGRQPVAAGRGLSIQNIYTEGCEYDICVLSVPSEETKAVIQSEHRLDISSILASGTPRTSTNAFNITHRNLNGVTLTWHGKTYQNLGLNEGTTATLPHAAFGDDGFYYTNTITFTLDVDSRLARLFNNNRMQVVVMGTGANAAPTGNIRFQVPSRGKINGVLNGVVNFSGLTGPGVFFVREIGDATEDWLVGKL